MTNDSHKARLRPLSFIEYIWWINIYPFSSVNLAEKILELVVDQTVEMISLKLWRSYVADVIRTHSSTVCVNLGSAVEPFLLELHQSCCEGGFSTRHSAELAVLRAAYKHTDIIKSFFYELESEREELNDTTITI